MKPALASPLRYTHAFVARGLSAAPMDGGLELARRFCRIHEPSDNKGGSCETSYCSFTG